MLGKIRALLRFIGFVLVLSAYIIRLLIVSLFLGFDIKRGILHRQQLMKSLIAVVGADIERSGPIPTEAAIIVGNHRSYFDPVPILSDLPSWIVVKSEVSKWPIIGIGLKISGVFYVERDSRESRQRTREAMAKVIREGQSLVVYPEGTTHKNQVTMPFKKGAFVVAAAENIPVIPVAIEYQEPDDAWVGDDLFFPHFIQCYAKPRSFIRLAYGEPIRSRDPEELLRRSQLWIDHKMEKLRTY